MTEPVTSVPSARARWQRRALIAAPALALATVLILRANGTSMPLAWTSAILVWVALWWLFEPVPAPVTSLLPLALLPALGVITPKQAAEAFGNELILLMAGGFMMALALERNGAHRRLALGMVHLFGGRSGRSLVFGFIAATGFISMWIANTAATLMMLPVAMAVLQHHQDARLRAPLILAIAYAASIGGWGTPIGTPPNLVFMQVYEQTTGTRMSFAEWMSVGVPIVIIFLPILGWWLTRGLKDSTPVELPPLGAWTAAERRVIAVFGLVVVAWVFRAWPYGGWTGLIGTTSINDASISLLGVVLMCLMPDGRGERLLDWDTAERIPWGALVLFAGGIALATAFQTSGLGDHIAQSLGGLNRLPPLLLILGVCLFVTLMSEIASNTATAVLLMPILAATATAAHIEPALLMMPAVLAASCGFMLPVATAPNLIAYGTRQVPLERMLREGAVLDLIGVLVLSGVCWVMLAP